MPQKEDLTGLSRLLSNSVTSWLSYFILIITGFLLPHFIDVHLGQAVLGVWDFCWAIINYLTLADISIGASISRYLSRYRINRQYKKEIKLLSTGLTIQIAILAILIMTTLILSIFIPQYISTENAYESSQIRWIIIFLGLSFAIRIFFDFARGILKGLHRWDIHSYINVTTRIVTSLTLIIVILLKGSLVELSIAYFIVTIISELARLYITYRYYHNLLMLKLSFDRKYTRKLLSFGVKNTYISILQPIMLQGSFIIIGMFLTTGVLAIYSRPISLIKYIEMIVLRYTWTLTPIASALQANNEPEKIKSLYIRSTMFAFAICLPVLLFIFVYGSRIIDIWMGQDYINDELIKLLSLCYILPISQSPAVSIMTGLNYLGKLAIIATISILICIFILLPLPMTDGWTLINIAYLMIFPIMITFGVIIPIYTCLVLKVNLTKFISDILLKPGIICIPFYLMLNYIDNNLQSHASSLITACLFSIIYIGVTYWYYIASDTIKQKIKSFI